MILGTIRTVDFNLNLIASALHKTREISSFSIEEILNVKNRLSRFKAEKVDKSEIEEYIGSLFPASVLSSYSNYLSNLEEFKEQYLIGKDSSNYTYISNFFNLKTEIILELKLLSNNLANLSSNSRNVKRFLRKSKFLDDYSLKVKSLIETCVNLIEDLENSTNKTSVLYENEIHLWVEVNKVKNPYYKLNQIPEVLKKWEEIHNLYIFIESLNQAIEKVMWKSKKEIPLKFRFDEIHQYFLEKKDGKVQVYFDLMYLLYLNDIIEDFEGAEYINIVERKEISKNLKRLTKSFVNKLAENKLKNLLNEFLENANGENLEEIDKKINLKSIFDQNFNLFIPKGIEYCLLLLDNKYQSAFSSKDGKIEVKETLGAYFEEVGKIQFIISEIEDWILKYEILLSPFESVTKSVRITLTNVSTEIERKKSEYESYLKTIKNENLRINLREFIDNKISELNEVTRFYEDDTSLILKEELPHLKKIRQILYDYKSKVQQIKEEVFKKLDSFKEKDLDLYLIIKKWEDNFNLKKNQLSFLLSLMLNKLFRSFKDLIEEEATVFSHITDITKQVDEFEVLPLNFALSSFLAEKLTEEELKERAIEIKSKINQFNDSIKLYENELSKLEKIIEHRVKRREGIADSSVNCSVCHNSINFSRDNIISCPYCGSAYHYLCVAYWLSNHNTCPLCQNAFQNPNLGLYED